MAGISLPKAVTVAPFVTDPNEPSFSQIYQDTLGNASTSLDAFDQHFSDMTALTNSAQSIADIDAADVQALSDLVDGLGTSDGGALAIALQPAADATDAALGDFNGIGTPQTAPTQPVTPPGTAPPSTQGGTPCKVPAGVNVQVLPDMKVGDAANYVTIDTATVPTEASVPFNSRLLCGDTQIFSVYRDSSQGGYAAAGPVIMLADYFVVTPVKPGTFIGASREHDKQAQEDFDTYYQVTIR